MKNQANQKKNKNSVYRMLQIHRNLKTNTF